MQLQFDNSANSGDKEEVGSEGSWDRPLKGNPWVENEVDEGKLPMSMYRQSIKTSSDNDSDSHDEGSQENSQSSEAEWERNGTILENDHDQRKQSEEPHFQQSPSREGSSEVEGGDKEEEEIIKKYKERLVKQDNSVFFELFELLLTKMYNRTLEK